MFQEKLDKIIQTSTQPEFSDAIFEAKKIYQKQAGEIHADDKFYENKIAVFLEWYTFDHILPDHNLTPLELHLKNNGGHPRYEAAKEIESFDENIHGIFLAKKIREDYVVVYNLFDKIKYRVNETSGTLLFRKKDIFEGRIIPFNNEYYFTGNFCFHPPDAYKFIKNESEKIALVLREFQKKLKAKNSSLDYLKKGKAQNDALIDKTQAILENSKSEIRIEKLKEKLENLYRSRSDFEVEIASMESEKSAFETQKVKLEGRGIINNLIHRLSYMHLKWERSRQIDIHDIYTNNA